MSQPILWKTCYVISQTVVKLGSAKNERVGRFKRVFLNPGEELQVRTLSN
jgi:hypothetical protein